MTDRQALAAAVLADPMDIAPRLVLADWLDDHGEDGGGLRQPALLTWEGNHPWNYPALWWSHGAVFPAVRLALFPDHGPPDCPCRAAGRPNRVFIFGRWWCWQCAAREAGRRVRGDDPPPFESTT